MGIDNRISLDHPDTHSFYRYIAPVMPYPKCKVDPGSKIVNPENIVVTSLKSTKAILGYAKCIPVLQNNIICFCFIAVDNSMVNLLLNR